MSTQTEKLASSLDALKVIQDSGSIAIKTTDLSRSHREKLLKNGFIQEVMKGWYIPTSPNEPIGESSNWYASFWGFCADYLDARFGQNWCLSPEQSISLHSENWTVPRQIMVRSPKGGNKPTNLLLNTSIFDVRLDIPSKKEIDLKAGIRIMSIPTALIACSASQYHLNPIEMRSALSTISDASEVLHKLLDGSHSKVAGRLAGAFRNIGRDKTADTIVETMRTAGYTVQEIDPFKVRSSISFDTREVSPHVNRIRMLWNDFRQPIIDNFPEAQGLPKNSLKYINEVDDIYVSDAYNSLSIEGYIVSEDLIEKVREGNWNPDSIQQDQDHMNAIAARGYWQAFQVVKTSISKVLQGANAGVVANDDHSTWYRELFGASVSAGIINATDLAGYRNSPVYIRGSMHTPPRYEAVRDLMPTFFDLLEKEDNPAVRVVLGHFIFVYIHPYVDGNGRIGRFLMNLLLASGGYPWLVIPVDDRSEYMSALESASVDQDILPFTQFLARTINKSKNSKL